MGKLTISMAIFNSYVSLPEGIFFFIYPSFPDKPKCHIAAYIPIYHQYLRICVDEIPCIAV